MDRSTAETVVKIYAILAWLGALLSLGVGLMMMFGSAFFSSFGMMAGYPAMMGNLWAGFAIVVGIVMLVFAALYVVAGLGLWLHKEWARILALVLSVLSLFSFPFGTLLGAFGIWIFGFEPTVKELFTGAKPAPAKFARTATKKKK